ncbi:MAG: DUF924 family protein [Pseudomonadota bacterium]
MQADVERILSYWLDEVGPDGWYQSSEAADLRIRSDFLDLWQQGADGELDHWITSTDGALALLILLDQFPRNMFRGDADAFRSDPAALRLAKQAISRGHDRKTAEPQRQFFYLPLMHSEKLADQERCVRMLMLGMPECGGENIEHAVKHREVIRKFGRFPSRNAALGRTDSDAELAYRAEGGYMS